MKRRHYKLLGYAGLAILSYATGLGLGQGAGLLIFILGGVTFELLFWTELLFRRGRR